MAIRLIKKKKSLPKVTKKERAQGILEVLPQIPLTRYDYARDASRDALLPGKRISKNNNIYWEQRENRSDNRNKKV